MNYKLRFPEDSDDLWNQIFNEYIIKIQWNNVPFEDYSELARSYTAVSVIVFQELLNDWRNNLKADTWVLPAIYLMRQAIELGIKSLLCRIKNNNKHDLQNLFKSCKHDLHSMFLISEQELKLYLSDNEFAWLNDYIISLTNIDAKSDTFRYPFNIDFINLYENKFLDNLQIGRNLLQANTLISKCINWGICDSTYCEFNNNYPAEFFIYTTHGFGNCHLWNPYNEIDYHKIIHGYTEVADYVFNSTNTDNLKQNTYPLIFLLRNTIEIQLKAIFELKLLNGVYKKKGYGDRKSHKIKSDLWKTISPIITYYVTTNDELSLLRVVEHQLFDLDNFDKSGASFRYPSTYSFEYYFNNVNFDVKNIYICLKSINNFLDSCSHSLHARLEYEEEMKQYYSE